MFNPSLQSLLLLFFLGFIACSSKKSSEPSLIFCSSLTYPPYESVSPEGKPVGFDIDVANLVAQKLNKKLIFKELSFDSLILGLQQGKCDFVMAGMSITPSRQKEITLLPYQGEPSKSYYLLFWEQIPSAVKTGADIQKIGNKTLAVQVGTWMEDYVKNIPGITPKALDATPELILDIQYKKSVAAFVEPHIAKEVLAKNSHVKFIEIPLPESEWKLGNGIGIKKSNTQLASQIQNALDSLKKSGELKTAEKKWFQTP